jgi:hyperosmotically inducible periplasmic protein
MVTRWAWQARRFNLPKKGTPMNSSTSRNLLAISSLAALLALGACDRADNRTVGERVDSGAAKTEQAARNAADDTKAMGAGAANKVDDGMITAKVNAALVADKDLSAVKINVDTKDGVVTLTGPAPSPEAAAQATRIAKDVKGVISVNNQLVVKAG